MCANLPLKSLGIISKDAISKDIIYKDIISKQSCGKALLKLAKKPENKAKMLARLNNRRHYDNVSSQPAAQQPELSLRLTHAATTAAILSRFLGLTTLFVPVKIKF